MITRGATPVAPGACHRAHAQPGHRTVQPPDIGPGETRGVQQGRGRLWSVRRPWPRPAFAARAGGPPVRDLSCTRQQGMPSPQGRRGASASMVDTRRDGVHAELPTDSANRARVDRERVRFQPVVRRSSRSAAASKIVSARPNFSASSRSRTPAGSVPTSPARPARPTPTRATSARRASTRSRPERGSIRSRGGRCSQNSPSATSWRR